jgi:putative transposase
MLFHVLNRGVGRMCIIRAEKDFDAFRRVVEETLRVAPIRICAYCWMPNHWHFVLWPERDGDLSRFMQRMANIHTQRWQRAKLRVGYGHLYQGRFKSFPLDGDEHFYSVVRYVERTVAHPFNSPPPPSLVENSPPFTANYGSPAILLSWLPLD